MEASNRLVTTMAELGADSGGLAKQSTELFHARISSQAALSTAGTLKIKIKMFELCYGGPGRLGSVLPSISAIPPKNAQEEMKLVSYVIERRSCGHWRLMITKQGYIGLEHFEVEIGDNVAVLLGGMTPFINRSYDSNYILVNEWQVSTIS